jgi:hypothetical protein
MVDFSVAGNGRDSRRCHIHRVFRFGRGVLGFQSGRSRLEPVVGQFPLCRRSGDCLGGNGLDPSYDVRLP